MLREIQTDPERGFYCLDWDKNEPFEIFGDENQDNYRRLELNFMPCNSIGTDLGIMQGELGVVNSECETSLEKQSEYIGKSHLLILANMARFRPELYGEKAIEKSSVIMNQQFE